MAAKPVFNFRQDNDYACGPAALSTLISGMMVEAVGRLAGTTKEGGTTPSGLIEAAKKMGFETAEHHELAIEQLKILVDMYGAIIVSFQCWGGGHYSVVVNSDDLGIVLFDPSSEVKTYFYNDEFIKLWYEQEDCGRTYVRWALTLSLPSIEGTS